MAQQHPDSPSQKSINEKEPKPPFPAERQESPGLEAKMNPRPQYMAPEYRAARKLQGKTALITGGDSGIGRAVAVLYAREGADVAITYLPQEREDALETKKAVEKEGKKCLLIEGDLSHPEFCKNAVLETEKAFGRFDILVSNAAYQQRKNSFEELTYEEWNHTFKVNVDAYFHLVKAAVPLMKKGGSIIATSSENALKPSESLPDYAVTKAAINQFSKVLAQMLMDRNIRVNVVGPGPVWTPLNPADKGASDEQIAKFGTQTPIQRPAQPEEIAPAFVFLASDADSSYISGSVIYETGGVSLGGT